MLQGAKKRTAMTLVELLVVMAIIVIFTAITAAFYPANQADRELSRFSNTVQSALLSARNRAKAERLPTGIRFYADPNSPTKVGSVVLIQKPAPLDGLSFGGVGVTETPANSGVFLVTFATPLVSGTGDKILTVGDYIVLNTGEMARFSGNVGTNQMQLDSLNTNTGFVSKLQTNPQGYKIFRGTIDLSGDTPFELSNTIEIFLASGSLSVVPASVSVSGAADIIFNPDGSVNNATSEVYLHLHNFESLAGDYSRDAILAVRKMSGSIGVYEVGPTGSPYQFAFDPRNKGI